jgi:soluble lytic murein transglycosylase
MLVMFLSGCAQSAINLPTTSSTITPSATPRPSSTPTPSPTPIPTPEPQVLFDSADLAFFYGDWDSALAEYETLQSMPTTPAEQGLAWLGLGKTLFQAGRLQEAVEALNEFTTSFPDHALLADGFFMLGQIYLEIGEDDFAIQSLESYLLRRPGILDAYVEEQIGDALRRIGQPIKSIDHYQRALNFPRLGSSLTLQIKIGMGFYEAGEYNSAVEVFEGVYSLANDSSTKASMNLLAGRAFEAIGDYDSAFAHYLDSVQQFPGEESSYQGLINLVNAGVPVDEFQRGLTDYFAEAYEPALAAFNRALDLNFNSAALFYRALTRRELGDIFGAIGDLQWIIEVFPDDPVWVDAWFEKADTEWDYLSDYKLAISTYLGFVESAPELGESAEALFRVARLFEREDFLEDAAVNWMRVATEYPASSSAFRGAFLSGISQYRVNDFPAALSAFLYADALAKNPADRAAARLWVGKSHLALGDRPPAEEAWRSASEADPTGYYSLRAIDFLEGDLPFTERKDISLEINWPAEQAQAETWLRETFALTSPDPLSILDPTIASDIRLHRAEEFWRLGMYAQAKTEFNSLRNSASSSAEVTYRLLQRLLELGLYQPAIFAARQVLDLAGYDDVGTLEAPIYFNHIRFGIYYDDLILPEAERYELDPLFVLSVARQESLFEGFITSYADARGLMQVIPPTGQDIATKLGWPPNYQAEDLYRPFVSVRFGAEYLAQQRELFDGDPFAMLSAYNAGPGNTLAWKALAPDDPDLFLEILRLEQPQNYIRSIYEFYSLYQMFYASS